MYRSGYPTGLKFDELLRGLTEFGLCLLPYPLTRNPDVGGKTPEGDAGIHGNRSCGLTEAAEVHICLGTGEKQSPEQLVEELNEAAEGASGLVGWAGFVAEGLGHGTAFVGLFSRCICWIRV